MFKAVILCLALVGTFAENSTGGAKESVGKGYGNVYQGGYSPQNQPYGGGVPSAPQQVPMFYNSPVQQPFFSFPPQIFPGVGVGHKYDSHYCSVHASFALALTNNVAKSSSSNDGNAGPYGPPQASSVQKIPVRSYSRQFCRYAAVNYDNCVACCKIAARVANTSPDNISAAIFSFDPLNPVSNGAGIVVNDLSSAPAASSSANNNRQKRQNETPSTAVQQCVCCAPKQDF